MLVSIFVVSGVVIWFAGIQLSKSTDRLDARLHLGSALGGLILLAVATNLPEIAITVTAAVSGSIGIAVGNILGGIALQTVVIAVLDIFGKRKEDTPPLTYRAASLTLVVEALVVVAILALVVAGSQLPKSLDLFRVTPQAFLILAGWVLGLILVRRAGRHLPWDRDGAAPDAGVQKQGQRSRDPKEQQSLVLTVTIFLGAAAATLVAGFFLEQSGDAASVQIGLSGILFGATVLALATSLPEISVGLQSIRQGDENLAISDIFGGNAFLPVLFLVAGLISGDAVLPQAGSADVYLTAIAALLTAVYAFGLLFRPKRRVLGMGIDSVAVVILYLIGIGGLFAISR
jgi:cation:H+ antiporter